MVGRRYGGMCEGMTSGTVIWLTQDLFSSQHAGWTGGSRPNRSSCRSSFHREYGHLKYLLTALKGVCSCVLVCVVFGVSVAGSNNSVGSNHSGTKIIFLFSLSLLTRLWTTLLLLSTHRCEHAFRPGPETTGTRSGCQFSLRFLPSRSCHNLPVQRCERSGESDVWKINTESRQPCSLPFSPLHLWAAMWLMCSYHL